MIKFDDLIKVIPDNQSVYINNKSYENKGDVDYCSANNGEICTYGNDKAIANRYAGYIVTDVFTNPYKDYEKIGDIRNCVYITIQNSKDFDC